MLSLPTLVFAFSVLSYVLAAPADLVPIVPPGGSFDNAPGPMMDFPLYCSENNCRHRKLIQGALPETAAPPAMLPPIPDVMTRKGVKIRKPSPIESRRINDFINSHLARPYTLHSDGFFSQRHKPCWTLDYALGRIRVFDDEDFLIYDSGFCHCVHQSASGCTCNAAELLTVTGGACLLAAWVALETSRTRG
ncbi:hypothetical protein MJO28_016436 [Puccinia striiformis f. sp. tritici]|uniref:Uncharacterized protein n=2 Tax=Puccinia striiformis TaxID=27350 RepID=A0A2S4VVG4_9BASI|nr:hypothetical protein MJO28_016436 [Puccinia striiformis f. sp. tritici]POW13515.1 hypothetical protein PSTT_03649 [Puccinia striiformis]